jgi:SanA protein
MLFVVIPAAILVSAALAVLGLRAWTDWRYRRDTYAVADVPARPVAIVFGAGVYPDGRLSPILADRVTTAVELYRTGKALKLLMTGDNRFVDYNEPGYMRAYALQLGVPDEDIVLDYAGRRTYDSCYRARHIFGVDAAILVTQAYHLDRALYTANRLGIDAVGVPADRRDYMFIRRYWTRELAATAVAWWQLNISHPLPVLGDKLPIAF